MVKQPRCCPEPGCCSAGPGIAVTGWDKASDRQPFGPLIDIAGQAFDITHVPNSTYYIQVTANPEKVLYETTTSNDVTFRKVILGGTPGHRTVKVPAWHGIDPEP